MLRIVMARINKGRSATMPSKGYSRPPQVTDSGLVVRHTTEDGSITTVFDFREVDCPPELLLSLANGFAVACGPDGRWRASISAKNGSAAMRAFVKSIAEQPNPPARIGDISPEVWWAWRAEMAKTNRWPSVIQLVQGLLTDTSGVDRHAIPPGCPSRNSATGGPRV
jgi:hypothetical protein